MLSGRNKFLFYFSDKMEFVVCAVSDIITTRVYTGLTMEKAWTDLHPIAAAAGGGGGDGHSDDDDDDDDVYDTGARINHGLL